MDKLKRVLNGQDAEDPGPLAEVSFSLFQQVKAMPSYHLRRRLPFRLCFLLDCLLCLFHRVLLLPPVLLPSELFQSIRRLLFFSQRCFGVCFLLLDTDSFSN